MANEKFIVSASPHIASKSTLQGAMLDVIIALIPALLAGWHFFGLRALLLAVVCICTSVVSEFIYQWLNIGFQIKNSEGVALSVALGKSSDLTSISDLSAVVTGMLLAMNLPVTIPFWMAMVGCVFAIVIVKQLFGGLGHNFVNPALGARAFMMAAWPAFMTSFVAPVNSFAKYIVDVQSSATPLSALKETGEAGVTLAQAFLGDIGGCVGEVSTLAILIGAAYLLIRRVIDLRIPLSYLLTLAVFTFLFGVYPFDWHYVLVSLCTGGVMLGAWFMATDYVTTPVTGAGQIVFGIGCGLLTFVIRRFGGYPEGTSYAILLMNVATPLIDRLVRPRVFGEVKKRD